MSDLPPEEPLHQLSGPYFTGTVWPDRVEVTITRREMSDGDNVEEFGDALLGIYHHTQASRVLIDIAALQFVASSGIGKFILLHRTLSRDGGVMVLVAPSPAFAEVLEATNLDRLFLVADTFDKARQLAASTQDGTPP